MRERKTFSLSLVIAPFLPGMLIPAMQSDFPWYGWAFPVLGMLISVFDVVYLLASEKSWHAVLCGLAGGLGLLCNFSLLVTLGLQADSQ